MFSSGIYRTLASVIGIVCVIALGGCSDDEPEQASDAEQGSSAVSGSADSKKPARLSNNILKFVPADTVMYMGTTAPVAQNEFMNLMRPGMMTHIDLEDLQRGEKPDSPAGAMLYGLQARYFAALKEDPTALSDRFGISKDWNMAVYSVDTVPVMRFAIDEQAVFETMLEQIEAEQKVTVAVREIGDVRLREYRLDSDDSQKFDLVIAADDAFATMTIHPSGLGDGHLGRILGVEMPDESLADTATLGDIMSTHNYTPHVVGFVDHAQVFELMTADEPTAFFAAMKSMDQRSSGSASAANVLATDSCRAEFADIATRWPRTVFGYTEWDTNSNPMKVVGVGTVESTNTEFLEKLRGIQGKPPRSKELDDAQPAMVLGMGIDIDNLLGFIGWFRDSVQTRGWQCPPLKELADNSAQMSGVTIGMFGAMLSGVKGFTVAMIDAKPGSSPQRPAESLDALLSVHTTSPTALTGFLMTTPFVQGIKFGAEGEAVPVELPVPALNAMDPQALVKDNTVSLFAGEKAGKVLNSMASAGFEDTFVDLTIDYGRYFDLAATAMQSGAIGQGQAMSDEMKQQFQAMQGFDATVGFRIDIGERGINFGSTMLMAK